MKSYNLEWNNEIKDIILKYKYMRKLHLDEEEKIKKLRLEKIEYENYKINRLNKNVYFIIKSMEVKDENIVDIVIYLLSNDSEILNNVYYCYILGIPNKESFYTLVINNDNKGFFFDDKVGIIKNFDRCIRCPKTMLSDLDRLKDIFIMDKKEDGYYINDKKIMNIDLYEDYADKVFESLGKEVLSNTLYLTIRHFGPYENIKWTYDRLMEIIKENNEKIIGIPMEEYIFGRWNSEDEGSYITNIMVPIEFNN